MSILDKVKEALGLSGGANGVDADLHQPVETPVTQDAAADESAATVDEEEAEEASEEETEEE